jgi:hypothetical protein
MNCNDIGDRGYVRLNENYVVGIKLQVQSLILCENL